MSVKPENVNMGVILLVVIILFVIAYNVYLYYRKPKSTPIKTTKQAELLFFYTDWCPHCTSAKPEWNAFKAQYKDVPVNGYILIFNDINCTKETSESESMMEKYKVEGYPTIKLLVNDRVIDFDAKPTKANLTQFVNTALN
jgi:thiol-disulfide isomerase/thioredoxin